MGERHEHGFIPGVFNYCDRWCERCAFSSRCRVYAAEMGYAVGGEEGYLAELDADLPPDPDPEEGEAGTDGPAEWELDEPSEADIESEMLRQDAARLLAEAHPLAEEAKAFAGQAGQLVEAAAERAMAAAAESEAFQDALEVLSRYRFFIPAKLHRALMGRDRTALLDEEEADIPSDADGSAKVAHITCAAARDAAGRLAGLDPALAPLAATCAQTAGRVLQLIDETFPDHRAFRRPGFDDPPGASA